MAQKGIREYDAKKLLDRHIGRLSNGSLSYSGKVVQIAPDKGIESAIRENPWLSTDKLVIKPDQLFGKRGKYGLILLNVTYEESKKWIKEKLNSVITVGKTKGKLTHLIIEPFIEHDKEYYLAFTGYEGGDHIHFSSEGGVDIEANWDKVTTVDVSIDGKIEDADLTPLTHGLSEEEKDFLAELVPVLFKFYREMDFGFLEYNPFTFKDNEFVPLDTVARLDDTAQYLHAVEWGDIEFPDPFGHEPAPEEDYIEQMDEKGGASLKLTILNPKGRVWTMIAGGGASVIYADTVVDLGCGEELANYGEYSGNPSTDETCEYAKTLLDLMTREKVAGGKVFIIGGGIANFTDVAKTFDGIIRALEEYADKIKKNNIKIYVRRGGPNYIVGLEKIREAGKKWGLDMEVHGPELHMTKIVKIALEGLQFDE